ncbi:MAG TPA: hypothetical protein VMT04_10320 [Terriglobales bacterium]|nr:hypothetical protein [Terriglobales bacterium]
MQEGTTLAPDYKSSRDQKKRKAIDLEFEEPVNFKLLAAEEGEAIREGYGTVLGLDDQGMLLLTDKTVKEGSYINLSMKFKGLGLLDGILGKVKKVEESEEHDFYVGVEFYSSEKIKAEALSGLFPDEMESFNARLKKSLVDYFKRAKKYREKVSV